MPPFTPCGTFDLDRRVPIDPGRWEVAYGPANVQGAQHAAVGGAPPQQVGSCNRAGGASTGQVTTFATSSAAV